MVKGLIDRAAGVSGAGAWLAKFAYDRARFIATWNSYLVGLGDGHPKEVQAVLTAWSHEPHFSGVVGGLFSDLAGAKSSKLETQLLCGAVVGAVSQADDFIDEQQLEPGQRVGILNGLFSSLREGKKSDYGAPEVAAVGLMCLDIYGRISASPSSWRFFEESENLKDAAIAQTSGNVSLEDEIMVGRAFARSFAVVPYCFNSGLPERFLEAAGHFGAYADILDDITDLAHDRAHGIRTAITVAESPGEIAKAKAVANRLYQDCLAVLQPGERSFYMAMSFLMSAERQIKLIHLARQVEKSQSV